MRITKQAARDFLAEAMEAAGISASREQLWQAADAFAKSMIVSEWANCMAVAAIAVAAVAATAYLVF